MESSAPSQGEHPFDPYAITRPDRALVVYYTIIAVLSNVLFPVVFLPLFFKYETLRYRFDAEGISVSWGILFRREIHLTYRRIQDIHVTRNIVQRWLGLATVSIQTASGSSSPEMNVEGVLEADALRNFLYHKMRGARGEAEPDAAAVGGDAAPADETLTLLTDIRNTLARLAAREG